MKTRGFLFGLLVMVFAGELIFPKAKGGEFIYEEPKLLTGSIYAKGDTNKLLFNFKRVVTLSNSTLRVQRDFTYPDGKLAAQERAIYQGNDLVSYELDDLQTGTKGSATILRDTDNPEKSRIEFKYGKTGGRPKTHNENLTKDTLNNDMVGPFILSSWDALLRGEKVTCRYMVVERRQTAGFTFSKDSETTWQGRNVVIIKMEASSRLVAKLVKPLFFTIEKAPPHRVFQYVGRTTPKIKSDGKWKPLDAVTVFQWP